MRRLAVGIVGALLLAIMSFPADMYRLWSPLPVRLDPYRSMLALLFVVWIATVLLVPESRFRGTPIGVVMFFFVAVMWASVLVNAPAMDWTQLGISLGRGMLMMVWALTFFAVVSLVTRPRDAERLIRFAVVSAAVLAALALVERVTAYALFRHLNDYIPILKVNVTDAGLLEQFVREGGLRVAGSASHPIAFAVMMGLLLPYAVQLCFEGKGDLTRFLWAVCTLVIMLGMFATGSRTAVVALAAGVVLVFASRPNKRMLLVGAALVAVFAIHMVLPGSIRGFVATLSPSYIRSTEVGNAEGRLEDYPRIFAIWKRVPLLGEGLGTQPIQARLITDNQYLKLVEEAGTLGALSLAVMVGAMAVSLYRGGLKLDGSRKAFCVAGASAALVFGASSATFDSFGFEQVTFLFMVMMALSFAELLGEPGEMAPRLASARFPSGGRRVLTLTETLQGQRGALARHPLADEGQPETRGVPA